MLNCFINIRSSSIASLERARPSSASDSWRFVPRNMIFLPFICTCSCPASLISAFSIFLNPTLWHTVSTVFPLSSKSWISSKYRFGVSANHFFGLATALLPVTVTPGSSAFCAVDVFAFGTSTAMRSGSSQTFVCPSDSYSSAVTA